PGVFTIKGLPGAGAVTFDPTGIVFNGSATDFMISAGGNTGPAHFIFSGEGGLISAWSEAVDVHNSIVVFPAPGGDSGGAVY
ncbi:hypothetical protein P8631_22165, partial [Guyparkeria sp. 1SP6A2]|nr:hypothetical protein [Guyparkeria sp. 1SP6A2]